MSKALKVIYNLHPPPDTVILDSHPPSKVYEFKVPTAESKSNSEFYNALREAVMQAKARIGADLTVWKDAMGTLENAKEPKKGQNEEDEGVNEGEEES
ncbi:hypothetical protein ACEPAI_324 [Sanghuangporus weigelae]